MTVYVHLPVLIVVVFYGGSVGRAAGSWPSAG